MAFILFVGTSHCGKSRLARAWAEAAAPERALISTNHRAGHALPQAGAKWQYLAEPLEPLGAARSVCPPGSHVSLVLDSLGPWISNLMSQNLSPAEIARRIGLLGAEMAGPDYTCAIVSQEGCGCLSPSDRIARKYAAILGTANQDLARRAHAVLLVSCGLPLALKGAIPAVLTRFDGKQNF